MESREVAARQLHARSSGLVLECALHAVLFWNEI